MRGMNFYTVIPCLLRPARGIRKALYHTPDLLLRQCFRLRPVAHHRTHRQNYTARRDRPAAGCRRRRGTSCVIQLRHNLRSALTNHIRKPAQPVNIAVRSDRKLIHSGLPPLLNIAVLRDDQAYPAASGPLTVIREQFLRDLPVLSALIRCHRRHDKPVHKRHCPDPDWFFYHTVLLSFINLWHTPSFHAGALQLCLTSKSHAGALRLLFTFTPHAGVSQSRDTSLCKLLTSLYLQTS